MKRPPRCLPGDLPCGPFCGASAQWTRLPLLARISVCGSTPGRWRTGRPAGTHQGRMCGPAYATRTQQEGAPTMHQLPQDPTPPDTQSAAAQVIRFADLLLSARASAMNIATPALRARYFGQAEAAADVIVSMVLLANSRTEPAEELGSYQYLVNRDAYDTDEHAQGRREVYGMAMAVFRRLVQEQKAG